MKKDANEAAVAAVDGCQQESAASSEAVIRRDADKKAGARRLFHLRALHGAPAEPVVLISHRDFVGVAIQRNR